MMKMSLLTKHQKTQKHQNHQNAQNRKSIKVIKVKSEKCVKQWNVSKKGGYVTLRGKCHFTCFPSHLVGAFLPNRMDPRVLRFRPKNGFSPFLMIFDTFWWFSFSHFWCFCVFVFCHFFTFFDFLDFVDFCVLSFLINFCHFLVLWLIFDHFCHFFRCPNDDTLFL